ncbi:blue-sensitive opsin-like isoform X1 [Cotesia glomerata]|uniref:blue-sensitive opsin-like isoform X1 n=1 Tax=Cotesia glomerata TaxID=32391 RepID=UPI001D00D8A1|nr:blue-sensitive opsin-like isoform X1 [Cotesia glomerata]
MSNNISDSRNSNFVYGIIAAVLGLIGFFGIILNLFVIVVIIKKSRAVWTPINITLVNLACGDFLVALLGDPFAFVSAYNRGWYWSHATCIWYAWFMSSLGLSSIGHLTVLAIERWFMIVKPMQTLSVKSSLFLAAGVWIYGISLSLPPLIGWGKFGYEAANISCSVSWELHDPSTNTDTYIAFLFFFGFIAPVTLICFSYTGIVRTLKKVKKRTEAGAAGKRERQVTLMVALMIIAFLFAWTPYATFALASQYFSYQLTGLIAAVPSVLAKSSICYNPIIYAGLNPQFRKSVKKMFGCKDSQQKTGREAKPSTVQINVTTKV